MKKPAISEKPAESVPATPAAPVSAEHLARDEARAAEAAQNEARATAARVQRQAGEQPQE